MLDDAPMPMLGGLSSLQFRQRYWQQRPLMVQAALPDLDGLVDAATLKRLAARDDVESRWVQRDKTGRGPASWSLQHGPIRRRAWARRAAKPWTLLVQGLDLHLEAAHGLLQRFAFVPWARLDDVMVSWASEGGGVGPHLDEYDVFLVQLRGRRRWSLGPVLAPQWQAHAPLKLLRQFKPDQTVVAAPGDLLYVPPGWGHDGVALDGDCMTASIGFRAPSGRELASDLLARLVDELDDDAGPRPSRFRDPRAKRGQAEAAGRVPASLQAFARQAVQAAATDAAALQLCLGESLTEPKAQVCFEPRSTAPAWGDMNGLQLDRRTRMLYDDDRLYINGEAFAVTGRDADILRGLADERRLTRAQCKGLSSAARQVLGQWILSGWLHPSTQGHQHHD